MLHAHLHLIPRRDGDVEMPEGGIRGAVPGKMGYRANETPDCIAHGRNLA